MVSGIRQTQSMLSMMEVAERLPVPSLARVGSSASSYDDAAAGHMGYISSLSRKDKAT